MPGRFGGPPALLPGSAPRKLAPVSERETHAGGGNSGRTMRMGGRPMTAAPDLHPPHRIPDGIPAGEWAVRCDLAAACRLCALYGWTDLGNTHISARVPGTGDEFLLNPFGLFFEEITASSLIRIDRHGNVTGGSEHGNEQGGVHHPRRDPHEPPAPALRDAYPLALRGGGLHAEAGTAAQQPEGADHHGVGSATTTSRAPPPRPASNRVSCATSATGACSSFATTACCRWGRRWARRSYGSTGWRPPAATRSTPSRAGPICNPSPPRHGSGPSGRGLGMYGPGGFIEAGREWPALLRQLDRAGMNDYCT